LTADSTWTMGRAQPLAERQVVEIVTTSEPTYVALDPRHVTWDWDRRNDVPGPALSLFTPPKVVFGWPALNQSDPSQTILALFPALWYSDPEGVAIGLHARTNYLTMIDRVDAGIAVSTRAGFDSTGDQLNPTSRLQLWLRAKNPSLPWLDRPLVGYSAGAALL